MKLARTAGPNAGLLSVAPALNVVFLLVVFYGLSSTFVLQPGIPISLPVSSVTLAPQHHPQLVSITALPVAGIYFQDRETTLEDLGKALGAVKTGERTLIIRADKGAPYDTVMQVTNLGLQAGYSVVLAAEEQR